MVFCECRAKIEPYVRERPPAGGGKPDERWYRVIRIAVLMHDTGKIGIDISILNKNGRLNRVEGKGMKKHPEIGWRILGSTKDFSEIADFVLSHQERWDGSGYPNGLRGDAIPL